jgi:hypothetical protein
VDLAFRRCLRGGRLPERSGSIDAARRAADSAQLALRATVKRGGRPPSGAVRFCGAIQIAIAMFLTKWACFCEEIVLLPKLSFVEVLTRGRRARHTGKDHGFIAFDDAAFRPPVLVPVLLGIQR